MSHGAADLVVRLQAGERPPEAVLVRLLRDPACPIQLVSALENCRWVWGARRLLGLLLRHRGCSLSFAIEALGRVGWMELLEVAREPRANPAIRRLAERRLAERVGEMSEGERISLAKRAPRALFPLLLEDPAPRAIAALLENPRFGEVDALRLVKRNPRVECLQVLLRHHRWGRTPAVLHAAIQSKELPVPLAMGIAVTFPQRELWQLEAARETPEELRRALQQLRVHRAGVTSN